MRALALLFVFASAIALAAATSAGEAGRCEHDDDCASDEACIGLEACGEGVCAPAFTTPLFPIPDTGAYTAQMTSVLDHSGPFYQRCCDADITAFTGEVARRNEYAFGCPAEPDDFPACIFADCLCAYRSEDASGYRIHGSYGSAYLLYAGHAGYDYAGGFNTPLVAVADGQLCKAQEDFINGRLFFPSAWAKFHTFYVDHGVHGGKGWASWYLHASELTGEGSDGTSLPGLAVGGCAPVEAGQLVGYVGNQGTVFPHLHFEMRRYAPEYGPEAVGARVVDPYGWTGETPDPWTDPNENPQAESLSAPVWVACGNGRVECGEDCDDGNLRDEDGCSSLCEAEPVSLLPEGLIGLQALALAVVTALWLGSTRRRRVDAAG